MANKNTVTFEVFNLDCWLYDGEWVVNNQMCIGEITVPEFFTTRKLFAELRKKHFLPGTWSKMRYELDTAFDTDGVFYVNNRSIRNIPELRLLAKAA